MNKMFSWLRFEMTNPISIDSYFVSIDCSSYLPDSLPRCYLNHYCFFHRLFPRRSLRTTPLKLTVRHARKRGCRPVQRWGCAPCAS